VIYLRRNINPESAVSQVKKLYGLLTFGEWAVWLKGE
jgi:hypothetical protein